MLLLLYSSAKTGACKNRTVMQKKKMETGKKKLTAKNNRNICRKLSSGIAGLIEKLYSYGTQ